MVTSTVAGVPTEFLPEAVKPDDSIANESNAQSPSLTETSTSSKRGRGAPAGNANARRHGLRCGVLGKGNKDVENVSSKLRLALENAVILRHNEVSILHAAYIQSCTRHEMRAMLLQKWLRTEGPNIPVLDRAALLKQLSDASDSRDRCLEKLGLGRGDGKPLWAAAFTVPSEALPANPTGTSTAGENAPQDANTEAAA